jgi:hypothetical protein
MKYGLLKYSAFNIGDDIQSLAAKQFLPRVDYLIDRDFIGSFRSKESVKVIMNGYMLLNIFAWPPPPSIIPLLISFHSAQNISSKDYIYKPFDKIRNLMKHINVEVPASTADSKFEDYYKTLQPIGCRDTYTLNKFQHQGLDAYLSYCLTLTLKQKKLKRNNKILIVDPMIETRNKKKSTEILLEHLPESFKPNLEFISHDIKSLMSVNARHQLAEEYLDEYRTAKLVITSRFHCAFPCLAFGTPFVFIRQPASDLRFNGVEHLLDSIHPDEIYADNLTEDLAFKSRSSKLEPIIERLENACKDFIRN